MKLLIVGDLHGQKPKIYFKDFDAIISIGDVCSDKKFRPWIKKWILNNNKGIFVSYEEFMEKTLGRKKIKEFEKHSLEEGRKIMQFLDSFGRPVFFIPGNWDQSYGKTRIKNMDKNNYTYYKSAYDYYLGDKINSRLINGLKNVVDCQYKLNKFNGFNFIGYGLSSNKEDPKLLNLTFKERIKLIYFYRKIIKKLELAYKKREKLPTIFLSHNMPYGIKLD